MLKVSRLVLRDPTTRALILRLDLASQDVVVEGTGTSLMLHEAATGKPIVESPLAHLEIVNAESIQYQGVARIRDSRELRLCRITLELD